MLDAVLAQQTQMAAVQEKLKRDASTSNGSGGAATSEQYNAVVAHLEKLSTAVGVMAEEQEGLAAQQADLAAAQEVRMAVMQ